MTTRRQFAFGATLATAALAAPSIARAQTMKWRMVTSWPKRLPGPGMSAERVAERIRTLSNGRLDIAVAAAGEVAVDPLLLPYRLKTPLGSRPGRRLPGFCCRAAQWGWVPTISSTPLRI